MNRSDIDALVNLIKFITALPFFIILIAIIVIALPVIVSIVIIWRIIEIISDFQWRSWNEQRARRPDRTNRKT